MSPYPEPTAAKAAGSWVNDMLGAVRWMEETSALQDVQGLPQLCKVAKGHFSGLGPSSPFLLCPSGRRVKVAAQCVKFREARRAAAIGPRLTIPDTFEGWFEILSEDGRAVRCIDSVAELARRFPETCLVRENVKAWRGDETDVGEKCRTLPAGETLVLIGETITSSAKNKLASRYLRCFTSKGEPVYLSFDQKGKFSPIAGEDNISGVHTIQKLLTKRFPLMVRMVHGKPPAGFKSAQFVPEMRLYSLVEDDSMVAVPLLKDSGAVVVPLHTPIKVLTPKNPEIIAKHKDLPVLLERAKRLIQEVSNKIHVYDVHLNKDYKKENNPTYKRSHKLFHSVNIVKRSLSVPDSSLKSPCVERAVSSPAHDSKYDEIDLIYDYVRGFAPLPDRIKNEFNSEEEPIRKPSITEDTKPEPPPIETIPVRKLSISETVTPAKITVSIKPNASPPQNPEHHVYEKIKTAEEIMHPEKRVAVRSMSAGKIFLPSGNHANHNKIFIRSSGGQKTASSKSRFAKHTKPQIPVRTQRVIPEPLSTSPLFNIRYKSLTNLAFDTLESSNSGGQLSSGSLDIPDRTRKLPRPKSLCNLFWSLNQEATPGRKFIFSRDVFKPSTKRLGTLYL